MLNLESLTKALSALKRSITVASSNITDDELMATVRAGVIQNFEVAYEQSWKMIQRWIKENKTPEDADHLRTRKDLFRMAAKYNLITNPQNWFEYGEARNITSHTYNSEKADYVYEKAQPFLNDAEYLLSQLESMND